MSHFTALVITDEKPDDGVLAEVLMPWHEYECTGVKKYLVEVDETDEVSKAFNASQKVVVLADGRVLDRYHENLYVTISTDQPNKTERKFRLPEGATEIEMPAEEARSYGVGYKTMDECAKNWCGANIERDGRFYRLTNPNKKWDWWQVGGRWMGMLIPKKSVVDGEEATGIGRPGLFTNGKMRPSGVDICRVDNLDIGRMKDDAGTAARQRWDEIAAVIAGRSFETFEEICACLGEDVGVEKKREEYWAQPAIEDLRKAGVFDKPENYRFSREEYVEIARGRAFVTHALVKDGVWYEKGEMGWWGVVHDEKNVDDWDEEFLKLVESLRPDQWVTVVDCHI